MVSNNPTVTIRREQHALLLQPPCPEVLDCLLTVEHTIVTDQKHGSRLASSVRSLHDVLPASSVPANEEQIGITMAGFESVVEHRLREKGYQVRRSTVPSILPHPDLRAVRNRLPLDERLLGFVQHHDRGVIRYGSDVQLTRLIVQIGLAYPNLSIVAVTRSRSEAMAYGSVLRTSFLNDVMHVSADNLRPNLPRIVVGTPEALMGNCVDIHRRDLVIALDAVEVLGKHGVQLLNAAPGARLLGFLPRMQRLAPRDADHLRGYFGFAEVDVPADGYQPLQVDVAFTSVAGGSQLPSDLDGVALRRQALWHNGLFNRRVAKLARAARRGDRCGGLFETLPQVDEGRPENHVAVLVQNVEHGLALAKQLPDWRLVAGPAANVDGMNRADRELFTAATQHTDDDAPTIFTLAAADQFSPREFDVLIRADAGNGLPPIADKRLMLPNGDRHKLLLVDFEDRRHHELGRSTRRRRQAYRQQAWYAAGADPVEERVKDFLATRPKLTKV